MKSVFKNSLAAVALAAATTGLMAVPAQAQVAGIATSSPEAVLAQSAARQNAYVAINNANSSNYQQIETLQKELETLAAGLDTSGDGNVTKAEADAQPSVWTQYQAKDEQVKQLFAPILLAKYYVIQQLLERYGEAQQQVIQSKGIQAMLTPEVFQYAAPGVDVSADILNSLNTLVPAVTTTPPANYQPPREVVATYQAVQQIIAIAVQQQAIREQQGQSAQPAQEQPSGR